MKITRFAPDVPPFVWDYAMVTPCGSQVTCNPAPGAPSDTDYLVHVEPGNGEYAKSEAMRNLTEALASTGWHWEGSEHYRDAAQHLIVTEGFMSWRQADVNLIVVGSDSFAKKHRLATRLCTKLNLPNRDDRVAVFQALLYGECDVHVSASRSEL